MPVKRKCQEISLHRPPLCGSCAPEQATRVLPSRGKRSKAALVSAQPARYIARTTVLGRSARKALASPITAAPVSLVKSATDTGCVAQLVEQLTLNQRVHGSSPCTPTNFLFIPLGHLLVRPQDLAVFGPRLSTCGESIQCLSAIARRARQHRSKRRKSQLYGFGLDQARRRPPDQVGAVVGWAASTCEDGWFGIPGASLPTPLSAT